MYNKIMDSVRDWFLVIFLLALMALLVFGTAAMLQAFMSSAAGPEGCRCIYGPAPK
jgi:hypothetical protein